MNTETASESTDIPAEIEDLYEGQWITWDTQPFELTLEIRRPPDIIRWTGRAGFLPRPMSLGILGTKGFFEFFNLNYSTSRRRVEIAACDPLPT